MKERANGRRNVPLPGSLTRTLLGGAGSDHCRAVAFALGALLVAWTLILGVSTARAQTGGKASDEDLRASACYASQMELVAQLLANDTVPTLMLDRTAKGPLSDWIQHCAEEASLPPSIERVLLIRPFVMKDNGFPGGLVRVVPRPVNVDGVPEEQGAADQPEAVGGSRSGLLSLEAARTAFLAGRPDAADTYWEGCDQARPGVLDEYWRDFVAVATPEEAAGWSTARSQPESERSAAACGVLRRAWAERALRDGVSVPHRLALHYQRLRYAREHYYLVGGGTRLGPQTRLLSVQVGRLDGTELDDRGLVYVRLGEPDRTATFSGVQSDFHSIGAPDLVISPTCYQPNVTWAYDLPGGTRLYHFSSLEGSANWWLIENLHDVYRCGDPTAAIGNGSQATLNPIVSNKSAPISQIAWLVLGNLYMSRAALDADYGTLSHRIVASGPTSGAEADGLRSISGSTLSLQGEFAEERQAGFDVTREMLTQVLPRPAIRADVPLIYSTLQFRAPDPASGEVTRVWLTGVAEAERLAGHPDDDGGFRYEVRATFSAVGESDEVHQRTALFTLRSPTKLKADAGVPVRLALDLPPGDYDFSVIVQDANDERPRPAGNSGYGPLRVRRYDGRLPQLSDVAFAPDSGGSWSPAPGVALPVTPVHTMNAARHAWLYFEAYGLSTHGGYTTEVRLQPKDEGEAFALTYPGAAPASSTSATPTLLRLELGEAEPGEYGVVVTVTDALGRQTLPYEETLIVK